MSDIANRLLRTLAGLGLFIHPTFFYGLFLDKASSIFSIFILGIVMIVVALNRNP